MSLFVLRDEFRAMGCAVQFELVGDDEGDVVTGLALARDSISNLELLWSRFLPDSDISRLNGAQGAMVSVDSATIELLHAMVQGFAATDGCFDPTLLAPLIELGYDASWSDPRLITSLPAGVSWRGGVSGIAVDAIASVAQLPSGTVLDAGGIGKGMAADIVVNQLLRAGIAGAMISIGGDLRVAGVGPHDGGWVIGVGDSFAPSDSANAMPSLSLANAGVATSGTMRRAWHDPSGAAVHHLLDPVTCRPIQETIQATVVAGTAAWAEVFTKMLMVRGAAPLEQLDSMGLGARVVLADRSIQCNDSWHNLELQCIRS